MKADRKMPHPTNNLNLQTLIDRCQIVIYIKSVSKFAWKPFKLRKKKSFWDAIV